MLAGCGWSKSCHAQDEDGPRPVTTEYLNRHSSLMSFFLFLFCPSKYTRRPSPETMDAEPLFLFLNNLSRTLESYLPVDEFYSYSRYSNTASLNEYAITVEPEGSPSGGEDAFGSLFPSQAATSPIEHSQGAPSGPLSIVGNTNISGTPMETAASPVQDFSMTSASPSHLAK